MFAMHPVFLLSSFFMAWCYSILLRGIKAIRFNCLVLIPAILLMTLFNTLNVHNGVTVLFYLNDNRITLEAIIYGLASAIMLTSVIIWFSCFSVIVTADKFIYLFGRAAPVLALTLSMIMRYIPLLQHRFREVAAAQRCMGRGLKGSSWIKRIRQFGKEVSILIAWSLEASIESADSMEARGYGLRGRSCFALPAVRKYCWQPSCFWAGRLWQPVQQEVCQSTIIQPFFCRALRFYSGSVWQRIWD